ncbi:MAG: hypothetical protein AABX44_02495 [Nanoarchaeota archaeon]
MAGKVLYVCRANIGRSQIAEAYHNYFNGEAGSAGTSLKYLSGTQLSDPSLGAHKVIQIMQEEGISLEKSKLTQITKEIITQYSKIIVMAEKHTIPDYLLESKNVEYWEISDTKGRDLNFYRKIRNEIKTRVKILLDKK